MIIIAHRGYSGKFPENTMSAFRGAVAAGADMIELDVTLTRDNIAVVVHDETLDRTTTGQGKVADFYWSQIRDLDAGSWLSPEFSGERIPLLEEAVRLVASNKKIELNIEIKPEALGRIGCNSVENRVMDLVFHYQIQDRVVISSFEPEFIMRIRKSDRDIRLSYLIEKKCMDWEGFCKRYNCCSINPDEKLVDEKLVRSAHDIGLKVIPYTVNDRSRMAELAALGVDGMFTNFPELLGEVVGRKK